MTNRSIHLITGLFVGAAVNLIFQWTDDPDATFSFSELIVCGAISAAVAWLMDRVLRPRVSSPVSWIAKPRFR